MHTVLFARIGHQNRIQFAQITHFLMGITRVSFDAVEFFHASLDMFILDSETASKAAMARISPNEMGLIRAVKRRQKASLFLALLRKNTQNSAVLPRGTEGNLIRNIPIRWPACVRIPLLVQFPDVYAV